jgi:hypothetical protein
MTTEQVLKEVALILRGEHPAWEGDSVWNAETYLHRFSKDMSKCAQNVALDINKNPYEASEISGLHPNRIQWIFHRIREVNIHMSIPINWSKGDNNE